ncbi:MAG: hypothetical protein ABSC21_03010 [Terriglobia bacterium]|jgi:hypothetical protein
MLVDSADCDWDDGGNATALAAENPSSSILDLTWSVRAVAADPRQQALYRGYVRSPRCALAKRLANSAAMLW